MCSIFQIWVIFGKYYYIFFLSIFIGKCACTISSIFLCNYMLFCYLCNAIIFKLFLRLALVSKCLQCVRRALIMLCLHKFRTRSRLPSWGTQIGPLFIVRGDRRKELLDISADAILLLLLYYLLYIGPMMQKGHLFLGLVQKRISVLSGQIIITYIAACFFLQITNCYIFLSKTGCTLYY